MMMRMIARTVIVSLAVSLFGSVPVSWAKIKEAPKQEASVAAATPAANSSQPTPPVNSQQPTIEFVLPQANQTISNYPIRVQVKVTNFELLPPVPYYKTMSSSSDMMNGHIHYNFDDAPALATDETSFLIDANGSRTLPPGKHVLRAELRAMNHKALKPPVFVTISINCQPNQVAKVATPTVDPRITKLRQEVALMQEQVRVLQGGETGGLQIGKTVGEGNALAAQGNYADAEAKYKEALALIPQHVAQNELSDKSAAILQAHVLTKLGVLYTKQKDYAAADSKFEDATKLFDANPVDSAVARKHQVECFRAYAESLRAEKQNDKAKIMDARADKIKV